MSYFNVNTGEVDEKVIHVEDPYISFKDGCATLIFGDFIHYKIELRAYTELLKMCTLHVDGEYGSFDAFPPSDLENTGYVGLEIKSGEATLTITLQGSTVNKLVEFIVGASIKRDTEKFEEAKRACDYAIKNAKALLERE